MSLIIETGATVSGANSFTTDAEFVARAALVGATIPATEAARDALQIKAVTYIMMQESKISGTRASGTQLLPYPRTSSTANGFAVSSTEIPPQVKMAQLELAIQSATSSLFQTATSSGVKREKLDVLEVEYFEGSTGSEVKTEQADAYLMQLFNTSATTASNMLTRV